MGFVRKRRLDAIKGGLERGEKGGGGEGGRCLSRGDLGMLKAFCLLGNEWDELM